MSGNSLLEPSLVSLGPFALAFLLPPDLWSTSHLLFPCKESSFVTHVESRKAKCNVPDCLPQKPLFVQDTVPLEESFCEKLRGELKMVH